MPSLIVAQSTLGKKTRLTTPPWTAFRASETPIECAMMSILSVWKELVKVLREGTELFSGRGSNKESHE
uniref:Uncharacterized protein n=1 Tax=Pristionchus pacificus TaxID=54126 RepID=A0A2A6C6G9_PRIPA|eukprot:PDM73775.1 hypothetical protein PRIPAC_41131 [Pristionchus pacificus]